jgi:hypothetical protein
MLMFTGMARLVLAFKRVEVTVRAVNAKCDDAIASCVLEVGK